MERQGQSKLGIASLLISIITAIGLFILFLIAGVMEANTIGGLDEESAGAIILGLSRALVMFEPDLKQTLKKEHYNLGFFSQKNSTRCKFVNI